MSICRHSAALMSHRIFPATRLGLRIERGQDVSSAPMLTAEIAMLAEVSDSGSPAEPNSLLAAALDTAATGMIIADACVAGFPIVYANAAFEALSGYSRGELIGRDATFLHG